MSKEIISAHELPLAYAYVLCNDSFMSGWGHAANRLNTCILPCDSDEQVKRVTECLERRREMKRIRTVYGKPRLRPNVLYSLFSPTDAPALYGVKQ